MIDSINLRKIAAFEILEHIQRIGIEFYVEAPISDKKKIQILEHVRKEFESTEEYEKCGLVRNIISKIKEKAAK